jgi:hypothetical protein
MLQNISPAVSELGGRGASRYELLEKSPKFKVPLPRERDFGGGLTGTNNFEIWYYAAR